jgi:hypothetical protein
LPVTPEPFWPNPVVTAEERWWTTREARGTNCSRRRSISADIVRPKLLGDVGSRRRCFEYGQIDHSIEMPHFDGVGDQVVSTPLCLVVRLF